MHEPTLQLREALLPNERPRWALPRLFRQPIFLLLPLGVIGPLAGAFNLMGDLAVFALNLAALAPLALRCEAARLRVRAARARGRWHASERMRRS